MRLIDADAFLQSEIKRCHCVPLVGSCDRDYESLKVLLMQTPAVDVSPVVYCKDCEHYHNAPNGLCYLHTEPKANARGYSGDAVCVESDDFCSYGEYRTNTGDVTHE